MFNGQMERVHSDKYGHGHAQVYSTQREMDGTTQQYQDSK